MPSPPAPRGGTLLILHMLVFPLLKQYIFCIALHSPKLKIKKRNKIYSDSQQNPSMLGLIKCCIKYPCFPFRKLIIFICGFSTKVTRAFLASETMEKWRFQGYIQGGWILATSSCVLAWVYALGLVYWLRILRDYGIFIQYTHQVCSTLSEYKCVGRFCILNFTVFSETFINDEIFLCKRL